VGDRDEDTQLAAQGRRGPLRVGPGKEVIEDKDKAREYLEKADVVGVVAMRAVGKEQQITSSPRTYWGAPYYASFWGPGYWG
jgi:hypothetical protein